MAYDKTIEEFYSFDIVDKNICLEKAIKEIIKDKNSTVIASKFINMLVEIIVEISSQYENLPIILTGGVFQNKTLLELVLKRLESKKSLY